MKRALLAALISAGLLAQTAHAMPRYSRSITETATITYYLPTGNMDASGQWPVEGYSVGCGWEIPLGATATFANGDSYICRDRGATSGPWIDFYATSHASGQWLVFGHAETCPYACYATVTYNWEE